MDDILKFLGGLAAFGVVAGGVAVALFQLFGERLIGHKFDRAMETLKDGHAREMEHLRFKINGLLDRTTKLNDREFEVLPEAWVLTVDAFYSVGEFTDQVQQFANVRFMSAGELEQFLQKSELLETEKQGLRNAQDKQLFYNEAITRHEAARVLGVWQDLHRYVFKFGIFIEPKLKEQFFEIDEILWQAYHERRQRIELDIKPWKFDHAEALKDRGAKLMERLEQNVQARLWNNEIAIIQREN